MNQLNHTGERILRYSINPSYCNIKLIAKTNITD